MHGGGKGVVGGLAHIDVIIGMQHLFAGDLITAVGNDLIGVHVGLSARTGLPHHQRKMIHQLALNHLIARGADGGKLFIGHFLRLYRIVCNGGSLFQNTKSVDDFPRHRLNAHTDQKVLVASLCLGGPILVGRYLYLAHRVMFNTILHCSFSFYSQIFYSIYHVSIMVP